MMVPARASAAAGAARALGAPDGRLVARLSSLGATLDDVVAGVGPEGGCVGLALSVQSAERRARVMAVARDEAIEAARLGTPSGGDARPAADAREAAEAAAWRTTMQRRDEGPPSDAADAAWVTTGAPPPDGGRALADALSIAAKAVDASALEVRRRVEVGQPEMVWLLASPCGVDAEDDRDAGVTSLAVAAAAAAATASDVTAAPWITDDGAGVVVRVHAPASRRPRSRGGSPARSGAPG
ncbi:MAG: hypothetical protein R3B36_19410 [Polyangiaceae bacterium]